LIAKRSTYTFTLHADSIAAAAAGKLQVTTFIPNSKAGDAWLGG
jgi:hypothetical protein